MSLKPISNLPELHKGHIDGDVDLSLLDVMGVDDFMSLIRARQEKNHTAAWDAAVSLAQQSKSLRSLISSITSLLSKYNENIDYDKLLELSHKTLNADRIVILKYDENQEKLVVAASREQSLKGTSVDINKSSEGEVFRTGVRRRNSDVRKDSVFVSFMDDQDLKTVSSVICSPIRISGKVIGVIEACNRLPTSVSGRLAHYKGTVDYIPFNQFDEMNLDFIAGIIGLFWTNQQKTASSPLPNIPGRADYDSFLDWIVNETYNQLKADRVSVFAYNDSTKSLECKISQDIKGMTLPVNTGVLGTVFTTLQAVTIDDAKSDSRHYKNIDKDVGYQTKTLICAPIVDLSGRPIGVIQALNKKDGQNFTRNDIARLSELCAKTAPILKEKLLVEDRSKLDRMESSSEHDDILTKSVVSIMEASSLNELSSKVEQISTLWGQCDFANLYLIGDRQDSKVNSKRSIRRLLSQKDFKDWTSTEQSYLYDFVEQALQTGQMIEQKIDNDNSTDVFLRDSQSVRCVMICPVNLKVLIKDNESVVLILGKKTGQFGTMPKQNIGILIQIIEKSARLLYHSLGSRVSEISTTPTVLTSKHVLAAVLSEVKDYIFFINGSGYIIGSNKPLSQILDKPDPSSISALTKVCGGFSNTSTSPEYHYTTFLAKHKVLCSDISTVLLLPKNNNDPVVNMEDDDLLKRNNYELRPGVHVDYVIKSLLVDVDIDARGSDGDIIAVIISQSTTASSTSNLSITKSTSNQYPTQVATAVDTIRQSLSVLERSLNNDQDIVNNIHHMTSVLDTVSQLVSAQSTPREFVSQTPAIKATISKFGSRFASSVKVIPSLSTLDRPPIAASSTIKSPVNPVKVSQSGLSINPINTTSSSPTFTVSPIGDRTTNEIHLITNPVDSSPHPAQHHLLVNPDIPEPTGLFTWEFNVLEQNNLTDLRNICGRLFHSMFDFNEISISPKVLGSYIYDVSNSYHANPFHNFFHATTTVHFSSMLLRSLQNKQLLSTLQMFAVMLSALVHDVDHPGNTNLFEIHTQSRLALRYNDQSVLENHHCSVAFQLMKEPRSNVLGTLPQAFIAETRKTMISCILATDMSVHFQLVDEIKAKITNNCDFHESSDKIFLSKIILHASDLSNPVRPFHISSAWAKNISEEFNRQVELETSLGLPVLGFMLTTDEKTFCKNELGFASFVVAPMWRNIANLFPQFDHLVKQLDSNLSTWKGRIDAVTKAETSKDENNGGNGNVPSPEK